MNHHNFMDWQERRNKAYKMAQWKPEEKTKGYRIDVQPVSGTGKSKVYGNHEYPEDDSIELNPDYNPTALPEIDPKVSNNANVSLVVPNHQHVLMHQILHELHGIHNGILPHFGTGTSMLVQTDPTLQMPGKEKVSSTPTLAASTPDLAYATFRKNIGSREDLIKGLSGSFGAFLLHHLLQHNPTEGHVAADHLEENPTSSNEKDKVNVGSRIVEKTDPTLLKRYQTVVSHHVGVLEDYLRKKLASQIPYNFEDHLKQSGHQDLRGIMLELLKGKQSGQAGK